MSEELLLRDAHKLKLMKVLSKYLPERIVSYCSELIIQYKLHLHIEVERKDRVGDYSPHSGLGNRISINHNLNRYDFLITFMHELAHHTAYKKYGNKHQPHGDEWKEEFKIFPPDIEQPLIAHMKKPKYTHTGDVALMKALMQYNTDHHVLLADIEEGTLFKIKGEKGNRVLQKGKKRRTYHFALDISTQKLYLIHGIAKVVLVNS
jgi:hypothetical protein